MEPLAQLLPSAGSSSSGTLNAIAVATRHFRQFFSAQEEENHGLVVFELRVGSNASSATENKKSPEEWSQLLYEQLSKKRTYGCSLADLQFAFPALPVEQIMEILTDLQMDGVVYNVQDKYLLL
uniref:Uncharacterized protein n=1 Tax=Globisporangium ultimum (strain ATCC 200006 / CBS 805.95 / DAOM BR144) TaxID=431595 RepID=K3WJS1_GLOUD